jgi:hypothetical protein
MRTVTTATLGAMCGALVGGAVTATALLWPVWTALTVEVGGARAALVPLEENERFGITFMHSVDDLPVQDWYVVRDGTIVQESTRMRQYGAGMGNHPGDGDGRAVEGWWEVASMNRPIGDLVLRVGAAPVDHRLRHPDGEVPLSRCWPRERVEVRVDEVSTLARLVSAVRPARCDR